MKVLIESDGTENIVNINSTANNGLAMPCGIKVGSPVGDMYKNFGMPWRTNFKKMVHIAMPIVQIIRLKSCLRRTKLILSHELILLEWNDI